MNETCSPATLPKLSDATTPAELRAHIREQMRRRPPLGRALRKDAVRFAAMRGERFEFASRRAEWINVLRMLWAADDYPGVALYRLRTALQRASVPVIPKLLHHLCIVFFGIRIGERVFIEEGLYLPHGNIVIDGVVTIGGGAVICPWTTIGLKQGSFIGPQIQGGVFIGTGSKILGNVAIGSGANIAAGAVVVDDVPAGATAAGVPARVV